MFDTLNGIWSKMWKNISTAGISLGIHHCIHKYTDISLNQYDLKIKELKAFTLSFSNVNLNTTEINKELNKLHLPFELVKGNVSEIIVKVDASEGTKCFYSRIPEITLTLNMGNRYMYQKAVPVPDGNGKLPNKSIPKINEIDFIKMISTVYQTICHIISTEIDKINIRFQFLSENTNIGIALEVSATDLKFSDSSNRCDKEVGMSELLYGKKTLKFNGLIFSIEEYITRSDKLFPELLDDKSRLYQCMGTHFGPLKKDFKCSNGIIPFCKFFGIQQFVIRSKFNVSFAPDVHLSLSIGGVYFFVTPRQIQQVISAINIFNTKANIKPNDKINDSYQNMMTDSDYQKVEFEIKKNMEQMCLQDSNSFQESWSCPPEYNYHTNVSDVAKAKLTESLSSFHSAKSNTDEKNSNLSDKNEIFHNFKLNITGMNAIILYEDILLPSEDELALFKEISITDLQNKAKEYFDHVKNNHQKQSELSEQSAAKDQLINFCQLNHFILFINPINLHLNNKFDDVYFYNVKNLFIGTIDLFENLKNDNYQKHIIHFDHKIDDRVSSLQTLTMEQSGNFIPISKQKCITRSKIVITVDSIIIRLDFTIIKRLLKFLKLLDYKSGLCHPSGIHDNIGDASINIKPIPIDISMKVKNLSYIIQFPIPDLCMKMSLEPKLRKEIVQINFKGLSFYTLYNPASNSLKFELYLDSINGYFQEKSDFVQIPILKLSGKENENIMLILILNLSNKDNTQTECQSLFKLFKKKSVISQCQEETSVKKVLLLPSDKEFAKKVFNETKHNSNINLNVTIPYAQASLPNKHIYEVLYNRFLLDLFVWFTEDLPRCYKNNSKKAPVSFSDSLNRNQTGIPGLKYSNIENPLLFFIEVSIVQASISIRTPYKENDKVFIGKHGDIILLLSKTLLITSNVAKCHENATYLCLDSENIDMYHQPNCNTKSTHSLLEEFNISKYDSILFPTKNGFDLIEMNKMGLSKKTRSHLLLSMEISLDPLRNIYSTMISCGLFDITLNYEIHLQETMWFTQLADVFNIEYVKINGYVYPLETTEICFHASNCLITYNPVHLPIKTIILLDSLCISHTSSSLKSNKLTHIFLEDSGIFISKDMKSKASNAEFVSILHLGYFELCHFEEDSISKLIVSNSDTHIMTCSDSCIAIMELVIYLTNGGDLVKEVKDITVVKPSCSTVAQLSMDSVKAQEYMKKQLADAIQDYEPISSLDSGKCGKENIVKKIGFPTQKNNNQISFDEDDIEIIGANDNSFSIIGSELGSGIKKKFGVKKDNLSKMKSISKEKTNKPIPIIQNIAIVVKEMTIIWHLYGGKDFSANKPINIRAGNVPKSVSLSQLRNQDDSQADYTPNSRKNINVCLLGGKYRNHDNSIELRVERIRLEYDYSFTEMNWSSATNLLIRKVEVIDRIKASTIKTFLQENSRCEYSLSNNGYMMRIQSKSSKENVAPSAESSIIISVRPLRLNVCQHALLFLETFFAELISSNSTEIGRVEYPSAAIGGQSALTIYVDGQPQCQQQSEVSSSTNGEVYIKEFEFYPALSIVVDYKNDGVINSKYGSFAGVLLRCGNLKGSEVCLKSLHYHAIFGYSSLFKSMANDWFEDIRKYQITSIIGGIGPLNALIELFYGVRDLIFIPLEQYKKNGRVLTGIRRGTTSFATSSAHATLDLTEQFLGCVQSLAVIMLDIASSGPREERQSFGAIPPQDMRDGVHVAIGIIAEGLEHRANTICKTALEEHAYKGMSGAVGGVIRQVPETVMAPLLLASDAACTIICGLRSQLNPTERREAMDKWKSKQM